MHNTFANTVPFLCFGALDKTSLKTSETKFAGEYSKPKNNLSHTLISESLFLYSL